VFWAQHMEHRLVIARALIWLDIVVFGGWNASTIIMNYLLLGGIGFIIWHEYQRGRAIARSTLLWSELSPATCFYGANGKT
jgi:hypothetical protein